MVGRTVTILEDMYVQCKNCNVETLKEDISEEGICKWCREEEK